MEENLADRHRQQAGRQAGGRLHTQLASMPTLRRFGGHREVDGWVSICGVVCGGTSFACSHCGMSLPVRRVRCETVDKTSPEQRGEAELCRSIVSLSFDSSAGGEIVESINSAVVWAEYILLLVLSQGYVWYTNRRSHSDRAESLNQWR